LRILMITNTFPPRRFGGITGVAYTVATKLAQRGHHVTVYTTDAGNNKYARLKTEKETAVDGLKVRYFRNISNLFAFEYRVFTPIGCLWTLRSEINSFDVVHIHDYRSLFNIVGWYFARTRGIPYVIQPHGSLPKAFEQQKSPLFFVKYISDALINEMIIRAACKTIALTQSEALACEKAGADKRNIEIIPNGLDLSHFDKLPARGKFRERHGIESRERIILFLARINKIKGLALLLNAFCSLEKQVDDVRLVIAGPDDGYLGQLKEDIKRLGISDKVLVTGPLYKEAKLEAFVDADVYVLPSSYDTFPLTLIEACACGAPAIVTNRCGIADAIREVGYVVDYDANQLQSAMREVVTNAALREEMGRRGASMVRERYNIEKIIDDLEGVYRECV
jgi:glycosyltransferase involved in cell wall biosynthesis